MPSNEVAAEPTTQAVVQLRQLRFRWNANSPEVLALDELTIQRGERIFIEGPSGSGKSTLLSLLSGISVPQHGELSVLGQRLDQLGSVQRDHFRAHHIGYIFQMFNLIHYLSMLDNVILPCRFSRSRHDRAMQQSGSLEAEALRLLQHLDMAHADLMDRPVTTLSVGQQQRVAAARALMGAPELLIADEPTSSLDADNRETFVKLLFEECRQADSTLVFVSHDHALENLFDRTIALADINSADAAMVA